ncbi:hypothetical protein HHI36_013483 [Cryptolaemus montrouzieri]|uniref:Uncharacterized protein n=1 Tax=Cryptolaemus montrouzieri TaxID=559131 RepID=A0ABD2NHV7_9CUCU
MEELEGAIKNEESVLCYLERSLRNCFMKASSVPNEISIVVVKGQQCSNLLPFLQSKLRPEPGYEGTESNELLDELDQHKPSQLVMIRN